MTAPPQLPSSRCTFLSAPTRGLEAWLRIAHCYISQRYNHTSQFSHEPPDNRLPGLVAESFRVFPEFESFAGCSADLHRHLPRRLGPGELEEAWSQRVPTHGLSVCKQAKQGGSVLHPSTHAVPNARVPCNPLVPFASIEPISSYCYIQQKRYMVLGQVKRSSKCTSA